MFNPIILLGGVARACVHHFVAAATPKDSHIPAWRFNVFERMRYAAHQRSPSLRYTRLYRDAGNRERLRRLRTGAHFQQLRSHPPGTVQPRHIFG